jgi:hypothetical protein
MMAALLLLDALLFGFVRAFLVVHRPVPVINAQVTAKNFAR